MRYHYRQGVSDAKTRSRWWWFILPLAIVAAGLYLLVVALAPGIAVLGPPADTVSNSLKTQKPGLDQNRLYIPILSIDVAISTGDESVLEKGAWHRVPENGDPAKGGNFVLSAHRFSMGLTPQQTRTKSPFYHIDQVKKDDDVYVDYGGTRYAYKVTKTYKVSRDATEIEKKSDDAKLTIYSCDLRGESAGREVVEARPVGTIEWTDGVPKLKRSED